jgi:hypothetical protein
LQLLELLWTNASVDSNGYITSEWGDGITVIPVLEGFHSGHYTLGSLGRIWDPTNPSANRGLHGFVGFLIEMTEKNLRDWKKGSASENTMIYRHVLSYRDALEDLYSLLEDFKLE